MTPREWTRCCALLTRLWPQRPMEPGPAEAFYPLLADLDVTTVAAAIQTYALGTDATWPPTVGQIRAAARPPRRAWDEALGELRATVRAVGAYSPPPTFDDPALQRVVNAYGWERCCWQNSDDPTVRAQFRDAYHAAQDNHLEHERREIAGGATNQLQTLLSGTNQRALGGSD